MNIYEILQRIPHRYPFILVDRVLSIEDGKKLHAIKNVSVNEPFFAGHYPEQPIMPGVLILEALAQATALLVTTIPDLSTTANAMPIFGGVDNVRFKQMVIPGDQLNLHVEIIRGKQNVWKIGALATVDENVACTAELTTAIREISKSD